LRVGKQTKAISSIILILIILGSVIIGALISYMWVMANFYAEPENVIDLIITDAAFQVDHADYFNVTVLNPSHSPSATNITSIYFRVEGDSNQYNVTDTSPEDLPIPIERATYKTIICKANWGFAAGENITVHVSASAASTAERSFTTQFVRLTLDTYFNSSETVRSFNATVKNDESSAIDLTLSNVTFIAYPVQNLTLQLPQVIHRNETISFQCFENWETYGKPFVSVETLEGYTAQVEKVAPSVVGLQITNVTFDEANPSRTNITLYNWPDSPTYVDITDITMTYDNGTTTSVDGALVSPTLPYRLEKNTTLSFSLPWSWASYRDRNVTITAYTKQGFTPPTTWAITPPSVIVKIAELDFNLTDTGTFRANITNALASLQSVNVTIIKFNQNVTTMQPSSLIILAGGSGWFNCTFDWAAFRGTVVNITASTEDGLNTSMSVTLPSIDLRVLDATFNETTGVPYVNVTILNTAFSIRNATITQITFATQNATESVLGTLTSPVLAPNGYLLVIGANVTVVCPWNWSRYSNQNLTITVQTAEGFDATFQVVVPTP
jgi:hypothetical protein